ncbi:hypothetical protein mRhiFer1_010082 [Rhinolophus ferrumequinum]|uniref:Uncharacterized protein n=1 Tax=Rhinolophus ferrumequinum TaxID=59479 RepID=A0A7J7Y5C4_RHIFE|nr:hypothetical protein mRhiFer1_010082 [Rhinolophus ferrumequinum]
MHLSFRALKGSRASGRLSLCLGTVGGDEASPLQSRSQSRGWGLCTAPLLPTHQPRHPPQCTHEDCGHGRWAAPQPLSSSWAVVGSRTVGPTVMHGAPWRCAQSTWPECPQAARGLVCGGDVIRDLSVCDDLKNCPSHTLRSGSLSRAAHRLSHLRSSRGHTRCVALLAHMLC